MQLQSVKSGVVIANEAHVYYDGVIDCFRKMYMHEGMLSFYKGIIPPILAETPKRAVKVRYLPWLLSLLFYFYFSNFIFFFFQFFTFEQYKNLFLFGAPAPTPLTFSLAGAGAGITEAIFVNPFEVVKVSMQSDRSKVGVSIFNISFKFKVPWK